MTPTITPHEGITFGATVTDVDLNTLDDATWQPIEDAFHEHAALVFPGQHLSEPAQVAFGKRIGEIEILRENSEAVQFSNKKPDGTVMEPNDFRFQTLRGNEGWHIDSTYMPLAAKAGLLSAIEVPSSGGETELADMRAAYDALDKVTKNRIADLSAYHSLYASQAKIGHTVETGSGYGYHDKGGAAALIGQSAPGYRPQSPVHRSARLPNSRHGRRRCPGIAGRLARQRLQGAAYIHPSLDAGRPAGVGQPLHFAPGPAIRLQ